MIDTRQLQERIAKKDTAIIFKGILIMVNIKLTEDEQRILDDLYGLPEESYIKKPTHIWIIEWLSSSDRRTGEELHKWMQERNYSFRSVYHKCSSKDKILAAIDRAAIHAEHHGTTPLIHLEAHGSEDGLSDSREGKNVLTWAELTQPLQGLNIATRCNLIVLFSACKGYAGFKSILNVFEGKRLGIIRIPALVTAGPLNDLVPKELLDSMKEFYRNLSNHSLGFDNAIISASNEWDCEIDRILATNIVYDGLLNFLIISICKEQKDVRIKSIRENFLKRSNQKRLSFEQEFILNKLNNKDYFAKKLQSE